MIAARLPLIGREGERELLRTALRKRESMLILGETGAGKTRLIRETVDDRSVVLTYPATLHQLLVDLSRGLLRSRHRSFLRLANTAQDAEGWLRRQTSVHLKGLLWTALETDPAPIVLDGIKPAGFTTYRFLQRLYFADGMVFIATARDAESLGALRRLFWNPKTTLCLKALSPAQAARLFDLAAAEIGLGEIGLADFKHKVLESAKGSPGQIIEMCRIASNPIYWSGNRVKFAPLRMDALMKFVE
jgi:hypothetical protein